MSGYGDFVELCSDYDKQISVETFSFLELWQRE